MAFRLVPKSTTLGDLERPSRALYCKKHPSFFAHRENLNLMLPETRIHAEDFRRWQYVSIFISFQQLFSKVARSEARQTGVKTEFNTK